MITIRDSKYGRMRKQPGARGESSSDPKRLGRMKLEADPSGDGRTTKAEKRPSSPAANPRTKVSPSAGAMVSTSSGIETSMQGTKIGSMPVTIDTDPMLVGLMPNNYKILYALYRDIYYNDPVGGSAVDLFASLPFGDFNIGGIEDPKILQVFNENVERIGAKTLIPEMAVDQLVLGMHCSSLLYNKERKMFVDVMPYSPENLNVKTLPFYSQEPIITATFPDHYKNALATKSPRIERLKKLIGQDVFNKIQQGMLELDPMTTVYIPRKTFSDTDMGVSYYRRLLPLYLIEKNLFRGTLVESARRQRGMLHVTMGDGNEWIPSPGEMDYMTNLFSDADMDPLGAIITTRMGISAEEIRPGGDFWKVTDFSDSVLPQKLRALSISEAFLSGDANYNVSDNSMTVFVESLRAFREMMTRKMFYEKFFPLISMVNGYKINAKGKVIIQEGLMDNLDPEDALFMMNDGSRLLIPTVEWSKQLKPEGDQAYMDMLQALSDKGVPVPIRVLAAAGGFNLEELLRQQDDDLKVRERLKAYQDAIKQLAGGDDEDGDMEAEASAGDIEKLLRYIGPEAMGGVRRGATRRHGGTRSLLSRDYDDTGELYSVTASGKRKLLVDQRSANERINRRIVKAMAGARVGKKIGTRHLITNPKKTKG